MKPSLGRASDDAERRQPKYRLISQMPCWRLQLSCIRDQHDNLLDEAARANLSARETLILPCEREIARKDHRRIDMALKLGHFPAVKELAGFDRRQRPSTEIITRWFKTWERPIGSSSILSADQSDAPALLRRKTHQ